MASGAYLKAGDGEGEGAVGTVGEAMMKWGGGDTEAGW